MKLWRWWAMVLRKGKTHKSGMWMAEIWEKPDQNDPLGPSGLVHNLGVLIRTWSPWPPKLLVHSSPSTPVVEPTLHWVFTIFPWPRFLPLCCASQVAYTHTHARPFLPFSTSAVLTLLGSAQTLILPRSPLRLPQSQWLLNFYDILTTAKIPQYGYIMTCSLFPTWQMFRLFLISCFFRPSCPIHPVLYLILHFADVPPISQKLVFSKYLFTRKLKIRFRNNFSVRNSFYISEKVGAEERRKEFFNPLHLPPSSFHISGEN